MLNAKTTLLCALVVLQCAFLSAARAAPETGWYWNPNESGRGFFVESHDGVTFIGAYLYDADGHATWFVAGGPNADPYNYTGDLYNKTGGQTLFGDYVAPGNAVVVGQISVHFSDDTHGTVTWSGGAVQIERQIFGSGDAAFQPFSGWWWNPDESGSGFSVEVQGNNLFIVGFMYDDSGRPVWYYSAGPMMTDPTTYHGDVLQFANGQTLGGPYHPPGVPTKVATLDIEFTATNAATLTFTETPASPAAGDRAKAAGSRSSTRNVQPQFPKPATFQYPQYYVGSFHFRSQVTGGLEYSVFSVDNQTLTQGIYQPDAFQAYGPARDGYVITVQAGGNFQSCNVTEGSIDIPMPRDSLALNITPYGGYGLTFTFPAVVINATIACGDGQPVTVPLPYPGQTFILRGAIPNKDLTGTRAGVTQGEISANFMANVAVGTALGQYDFVPNH